MSEYDRIWMEWNEGRLRAREEGHEPVLCLMDYITYHEFLGALAIKVNVIGLSGKERSRTGPVTWEGIDVWPSTGTRVVGMVFGYRDDNVIL